MQSKLIQKDETLTINIALDIARTEEVTQKQLESIATLGIKPVHALSVRPKTQFVQKTYSQTPPGQHHRTKCGMCGRSHASAPITACPAYGTTCDACGIANHWRPMCHSKLKQSHDQHQNAPNKQVTQQKSFRRVQPKPKQMVHSLETNMPSRSDDNLLYDNTLFFDTLHVGNLDVGEEDTEAIVEIMAEAKHGKCVVLTCKLDTGAQGDVIPVKMFKRLLPDTYLKKCDSSITAFGGHVITPAGMCALALQHRGTLHTTNFYVVEYNGPVILGLPSCRALQLVTINYSLSVMDMEKTVIPTTDTSLEDVHTGKPRSNTLAKAAIMKEYPDRFQGVGCFAGEYHISLDPTVALVIHPPRRIPNALRDSLKGELDKLVEQEIVAKVEQPTDWVNSFVCTTKPSGGVRLCLDPKDLNRAIKRPHHFTPTFEDILPKLNNAKFFSILDARSGYWNIKLDDESSYYTTFNTPYGRYRFLRLPFGLVCAQDVFQRKVDETLRRW